MRKIIDYKIIARESTAQLEKEVLSSIAEGWQPYGELLHTKPWATYNEYQQVMVKYAVPAKTFTGPC